MSRSDATKATVAEFIVKSELRCVHAKTMPCSEAMTFMNPMGAMATFEVMPVT